MMKAAVLHGEVEDAVVPASQKPHSAPVWAMLQQLLQKTLAEAVPPGSKVIYVDYPVSKNVGDLLIYLGTLRWLELAKLNVVGIFSGENLRFDEIDSDTIILVQGGGNFGDIYPKHQLVREELCRRYPHNRIVSLPQTIYFQDSLKFGQSGAKINAHGSFYVFCRCEQSLELARAHMPNCHPVLAPDMATFLYPLRDLLSLHEASASNDTYFLLRDDVERSTVQAELEGRSDLSRGDWVDLIGISNRAIGRALYLSDRTAFSRRWPSTFERLWRTSSRRMVLSAAKVLCQHREIVTSRLHGHIMSCLLDIPNSLIDNSYGKNSAYAETWHQPLISSGFVKILNRKSSGLSLN